MKLRIHLSLTEQSLSADRYWEKIFRIWIVSI